MTAYNNQNQNIEWSNSENILKKLLWQTDTHKNNVALAASKFIVNDKQPFRQIK